MQEAVRFKDERYAYRLLANNLQTTNEMDLEYQRNNQRIQQLTYERDTDNWDLDMFICAHKDCHNIQDKLHDEYDYQNFQGRDKVTRLLEGIRNSEYNPVIMSINLDTNSSRVGRYEIRAWKCWET